jgi:hypothetical protein
MPDGEAELLPACLGHHRGTDLVSAADEPLIGFMRDLSKQSLMIVGLQR